MLLPFRHVRCALAVALIVSLFATDATRAQSPCGDTCGTLVGPNASGTWNVDGSPYCITTDVNVGSLTIEPGVCVLVDGAHTINVTVRLKVLGTEDQPVTITSKDPAARWHGILFDDVGSGSEFNHCTISRSDSSAVRITGKGVVPPLFRYCQFEDNTAYPNGGAIQASVPPDQLLDIEHCVFRNNAANPDLYNVHCVGGALATSGPASISDCTFDGNKVSGIYPYGGAISCDDAGAPGASILFERCAVLNSETHGTDYPGPAVAAFYIGGGEVEIRNSFIACNLNSGYEGKYVSGILVDGGNVALNNCTIAHNQYRGLEQRHGTVTVHNSILYFNYKTGENSYDPQYAGTIAKWSYSDVQNELVPGDGNISKNPAFRGDGCDTCSLSVICDSLAVDAGDPGDPNDPDNTPEMNNDVCFSISCGTERNDMGARGGPGACGWNDACYADCDRSCTLDLFDFLCFTNDFNAEDAHADCDGNGTFDLFDFLCFVNAFNKGC